MEIPKPDAVAAPADYDALARALDYHLLAPEMNEEELYEGCRLARNWKVGTVVVRPSDVDLAVRWLKDTPVRVCGVVSYPFGASTTSAKLYETHDVLRRGAVEVEAVLNIGKLASRHFQYTEYELLQLAEETHKAGGFFKAMFDAPLLADEAKIVSAKICKRASVDMATVATGFAPKPWTLRDLDMLVWKCAPLAAVKAVGIPGLDEALEVWSRGVTRIGTRRPEVILEAWEKRLAAEAKAKAEAAVPSV